MNFKLETDLTVEHLPCVTNSPAVFWSGRKVTGWYIIGFNFSPWVVRLWVRVVRWRENLHRGR